MRPSGSVSFVRLCCASYSNSSPVHQPIRRALGFQQTLLDKAAQIARQGSPMPGHLASKSWIWKSVWTDRMSVSPFLCTPRMPFTVPLPLSIFPNHIHRSENIPGVFSRLATFFASRGTLPVYAGIKRRGRLRPNPSHVVRASMVRAGTSAM